MIAILLNHGSKYKSVPYLQCSGAQYINTEVATDTSLYVEVTASCSDGALFGVTQGTTYCQFRRNSSNFTVQYGTNGTDKNITYVSGTHTFVMDVPNRIVQIDGSTVTTLTTSGSTTQGLRLCANYSSAGAIVRQLTGQIYEAIIKMNGVVVRHYVPRVRRSDGVAGLYDLIEKTFNPSAGSPFVAGS